MNLLAELSRYERDELMPSKKEIILQLINEGKTQDELFSMGYNKKYVKEVIRNAKKQMQDKNTSFNEIKSNPIECDNFIEIQKDVREIKNLLITRQWSMFRIVIVSSPQIAKKHCLIC